MRCKHCDSEDYCRSGFNKGKQRYECRICGKTFTDTPPRGASKEKKEKAFELYTEGMTYRGIGRFLKVSHVSIQNWVDEIAKERCNQQIENKRLYVVEIDEMWHFIKKRKIKYGSGK
jgi:transposase-like protein